MEGKFFFTVFAIMVFLLGLCIFQIARLEYRYEILNFLETRNLVALGARQVARQYITALKRKDYKTAYYFLTPDSRKRIPFADFVCMNEKAMTLMDEDYTWIFSEKVTVAMAIYQDPAAGYFVLKRIRGKWKIIICKGIPSFPLGEGCEW